MNSPPKSSAMRALSARNSRTMKDLNKELLKLDVERKHKMKELNQATKHFLDMKLRPLSARSRETSPDRCNFVSLPAYARDRSISRSPSPSPRSPLDDSFSSTSPRNKKIVYRKSISTDECITATSSQISPKSSPESQQKLLSKRNKDNQNQIQRSHSISDTSITHVAYLSLPGDGTGLAKNNSNPTSPRNKATKPSSSNVGIPKIIVSDTTPKLPEIVPSTTLIKSDSPLKKVARDTAANNFPAKKDSKHSSRNNSPTKKDSKHSPRNSSPVKKDSNNSSRNNSPARKDSNDSTVSNTDVIDGALHVPIRRSRSNSVPSISSSIHQMLVMNKAKPTSTADDSSLGIDKPIELRPRSSSICVPYFLHLKNAPRRDSLLRKYIARPKIFHRTAKTIDQLISDLAKGISNEELLDYKNRSKPITAEEWESLKKCRYLRMPSKNDDVSGNTIDINAIFSE